MGAEVGASESINLFQASSTRSISEIPRNNTISFRSPTAVVPRESYVARRAAVSSGSRAREEKIGRWREIVSSKSESRG